MGNCSETKIKKINVSSLEYRSNESRINLPIINKDINQNINNDKFNNSQIINQKEVIINNTVNILNNNIEIKLQNENIKKTNYSELNLTKNYYLKCPICQFTNITIIKYLYLKEYNDYMIYYSCYSDTFLSNNFLLQLLNVVDEQEVETNLSEKNAIKIKEILADKNEEFKGYPILENILKSSNYSYVQKTEERNYINNELMSINENNLVKQIIWLDEKINSEENQKYLKILNNNFNNVIAFQKEQELFDIIENFQFEVLIIIMNGKNFSKYMNYILNNSIYNIPVSIIFTKNEEYLKQKLQYKEFLEHKFYNSLGVSNTIENLIMKIKNFINQFKVDIKKINLGHSSLPNDYNDCFIFEYIDDDSKLIFPYLYNNIMRNSKLSNEEIKQTNRYILENYGEIDSIKNLIMPLLLIENIPNDIIAKFWGRIYTIESPFYRNLNNNLMKLKNENYNEYIQMLYAGLKEFEYKGDEQLYRGANISDIEIDNILNFYKNINEMNEFQNKNLYLIYSRAFLSFSKNKVVSLKFLKDIKNTKKVIFLIKNSSNNKILSNAYLFKISVLPDENEVLFFPFSAFIIKNIINIDNIFYISLEYIGIYEERIKTKIKKVSKEEMSKIMNKSSFSLDAFKLKIIPKKFERIEDDIATRNIINNIIEINNDNSLLDRNDKFNSTEINCIYNVDKNEIKILNNHQNKGINKEINEDNIEIFINDKKVNFSFIYKSDSKEEIKVKFKFNKLINNMSYMFHKCFSLKSIDLFSFNTSNATNMSFMFSECSSLKILDLKSFNTSNVKDMSNLFSGCSSLEFINISSFQTSKVKNMESMFSGCSSLKSINLSSFNTKNVTNMSNMFLKCYSLKELDLSSFNTRKVTNMSSLFHNCSSLEKINLISFNTSNVEDMSYMFSCCSSLKSVDLSNFNIDRVSKNSCMFFNCTYLWKEIIKFNHRMNKRKKKKTQDGLLNFK